MSVEGGFIVEQVTGYLTSRIKVLWHVVSVGRVFCQTQSTTHYLDVYPNSVNRVLRNWSQSTTDNYPVGSTGLFIEVHAPGYVGDLKYIWQLPSGWKFHHIMPYEQRFENHIWILTEETSEGVVKVYAENECGSRSAVLTIPVTRKAQ